MISMKCFCWMNVVGNSESFTKVEMIGVIDNKHVD